MAVRVRPRSRALRPTDMTRRRPAQPGCRRCRRRDCGGECGRVQRVDVVDQDDRWRLGQLGGQGAAGLVFAPPDRHHRRRSAQRRITDDVRQQARPRSRAGLLDEMQGCRAVDEASNEGQQRCRHGMCQLGVTDERKISEQFLNEKRAGYPDVRRCRGRWHRRQAEARRRVVVDVGLGVIPRDRHESACWTEDRHRCDAFQHRQQWGGMRQHVIDHIHGRQRVNLLSLLESIPIGGPAEFMAQPGSGEFEHRDSLVLVLKPHKTSALAKEAGSLRVGSCQRSPRSCTDARQGPIGGENLRQVTISSWNIAVSIARRNRRDHVRSTHVFSVHRLVHPISLN